MELRLRGVYRNVEQLHPPEVTNVRRVVWYPHGTDEDITPFVYIVVGRRLI